MNDQDLLRYSRHILLPAIVIAGQQALLDAKVLVVGLGGLGSPVALYLAASGVGELYLMDDDTVDLSNLQRQIAHGEADIGRDKVESAAARIAELNTATGVHCLRQRLDEQNLPELDIDLVIDASDSFVSRYAANRLSLNLGVPLVSAAAIGMQGQIAVLNDKAESPCYECLYPRQEEQEELRCAEAGVAAPLVGVLGSMQALEALKLIVGIDEASGQLSVFDALASQWQHLRLPKREACPACS
jgi:adenylyltransferase/sulfurtransferase